MKVKDHHPAYQFVRLGFVEKIERELDSNTARKGDWSQWKPDPFLLASEFNWHLAKLLKAIEDNNRKKVSEYAADCAAYAMKADEIFGETGGVENTK